MQPRGHLLPLPECSPESVEWVGLLKPHVKISLMQLRETGLIGDFTNKNSSELGCASWRGWEEGWRGRLGGGGGCQWFD